MKVMEGVLIELPVLLALSANSPFWRGEADGPRSHARRRCSPASRAPACRRGSTPTTTTPRRSAGWRGPARSATTRTSGGTSGRTRASARSSCASWTCSSTSSTRWRSPAYVQALVAALIDDVENGKPAPSYHRLLVAENKWLAARYGLEAPLMDLATGRRTRVVAATLAPPPHEAAAAVREGAGLLDALSQGIEQDPRERHRRDPAGAGLARERGPARDAVGAGRPDGAAILDGLRPVRRAPRAARNGARVRRGRDPELVRNHLEHPLLERDPAQLRDRRAGAAQGLQELPAPSRESRAAP